MSRSPIVHCHFMLQFYERINDDDEILSCVYRLWTVRIFYKCNPGAALGSTLCINLTHRKISES